MNESNNLEEDPNFKKLVAILEEKERSMTAKGTKLLKDLIDYLDSNITLELYDDVFPPPFCYSERQYCVGNIRTMNIEEGDDAEERILVGPGDYNNKLYDRLRDYKNLKEKVIEIGLEVLTKTKGYIEKIIKTYFYTWRTTASMGYL